MSDNNIVTSEPLPQPTAADPSATTAITPPESAAQPVADDSIVTLYLGGDPDSLMTEEQTDMVRLSVYFIIVYLVFLVVSFFILKWVSKFDLITGLIRFMRKTNSSKTCIIVTIVFYLIYLLLCPIIIALAWAMYVYAKSEQSDGVIAGAIFLMIIFSTFVIFGAVVWYGAKWHVSKAVIGFFATGVFAAWLFTLAVALTPGSYSFSGVSGILWATNFVPACYILQKKTVWKDIPLYSLFKGLALKMAGSTEHDLNMLLDMTPLQKREHNDNQLKALMSEATQSEMKHFTKKLVVAVLIYLVTMGVYIGIFAAKESADDTVQSLSLLNPIFILGSDLVILSLRAQTVVIRVKDDQQSFIYSPTFQSVVLLFNRALLCYNKEYWLVNQALVYFIVQVICAYDVTQTVFLNSLKVRDEHSDIVEILRVCPVLQAKVQKELPELKTKFSIKPANCCCDFGACQWRKFRTQVASALYFLFFIGLNYVVSLEPDSLQTKRVIFVNEVGQWVYGYLAIAATIVLVFYILWYRSFKNSGYIFTCGSLLLYILFQGVSIAVGLFFYSQVDGNIDLILTVFILMPIIVCSFSSFFGVWYSNDFHAYEHSFASSKKFNPDEVDTYNKQSCFGKIKQGAWKPQTRKDCILFMMLLINFLAIFAFMIVTPIIFKPEYVGITIAMLILVFETSFITVWKYLATGFKMEAPVVVAMLASVLTMVAWVLYVAINLVTDEDEPDMFRAACVVITVAYFVFLIGTLLYLEYLSVQMQAQKLTCSFWILFGLTFLVLFGVGAALIFLTSYGLVGIVWIAVWVYVLLNMLLYAWRKILAAVFAILFVGAGVLILMTSDNSDTSFSGVSVLYFGMFILSFGAFIQVYATNKIKKRRSIFMNSPEVMPMLEYNLDTQKMKNANGEPMLFFFFVYVVLMWAFSTTIISDVEWRYIPLSIIGLTLAFSYIYIIEKNVAASSIDRKFFLQATNQFYTSCLVTATDYKKKWRNSDRDIKSIGVVEEAGSDLKFENRAIYIKELQSLQDWAELTGSYKKDLGCIGFFDSISRKPEKVKTGSVAPDQSYVHDSQVLPESQLLASQVQSGHEQQNNASDKNLDQSDKFHIMQKEGSDANVLGGNGEAAPEQIAEVQGTLITQRYISKTGDVTLIKMEKDLASYVGKPTKEGDLIDAWCELQDKAKDEDYFDKKFWAFLNGYLNLKMAQLLASELSIIESSVKMYLAKCKVNDPECKLDINMNFGAFLEEMKDEPKHLVDFNIFLADEFVESESNNLGNNDDQDDSVIREEAKQLVGSQALLRKNIAQLKADFAVSDKRAFTVDSFIRKCTELLMNVLLDRTSELNKAAEMAQKEEKERDRMRRKAEEKRRNAQKAISDAQEAERQAAQRAKDEALKKQQEAQDALQKAQEAARQAAERDAQRQGEQDDAAKQAAEMARMAAEEAARLAAEAARQAEEDAKRASEEQARLQKLKQEKNSVVEVADGTDTKKLKEEGDKALQLHFATGKPYFVDEDFSEAKARDKEATNYVYIRAKEIKSANGGPANVKNLVFSNGAAATDVNQGGLGDCYLLSAMSIIAHSRPDLLTRIFHPNSREFREDGIYSMMIYEGKIPHVVTVDDKLFCLANRKIHAFAQLKTDLGKGEREIWPQLIEKAYAKFHGSYTSIVGGQVSTALMELTNGVAKSYSFKDADVESMFNTGQLWSNVLQWHAAGHLLGAGTPPGSDSTNSNMGIVNGHAYAILDVAVIDGNNLVQLRNPWGSGVEWKGAWGDGSDSWNERAKKAVYERMKKKRGQAFQNVDKVQEDGIFWMSFNDFFMHYRTLYLCRFFDDTYKEIYIESEFSVANNMAGGCMNNESVGDNPQYLVHIKPQKGRQTVNCFFELNLQGHSSQDDSNHISIGFEFFTMNGEKVPGRRLQRGCRTQIETSFTTLANQTLEYEMPCTQDDTPYTVLLSTFEPGKEAAFRFTCYFKHAQGTVTIKKFE